MKSHKIAIAIVLLMIIWIASGAFTDSKPKSVSEKSDKSSITEVSYIISTAQQHIKQAKLYGRTEESKSAFIRAETNGKVTKLTVNDGDIVQKGDIILIIEKRDKLALLAKAKAALNQREIELKSSKELSRKGFQAETKLAEATSRLEQARADFIIATIELENTEVKAPFNGIIESIYIEEGEIIAGGFSGSNSQQDSSSRQNSSNLQGGGASSLSIAKIIEINPIIIVGGISEVNMSGIYIGKKATANLVTGQEVSGKISFVGKVADPITRTFRIELEADNNDYAISAGVTAEIIIPSEERPAHLISSSHLSIDDEGNLGVKAISMANSAPASIADDTNSNSNIVNATKISGTVAFYPVKTFDNEERGVWITGLPEQINMITTGHPFVNSNSDVIGILDE